MKNTRTTDILPEGYREILSVNLQKNKRLALFINLFAITIAAVLVIPVCFAVPFSALFDMSEGIGIYILRFATLIVGIVAYMVLHELIHGITMKLFGAKKIKYGFTGLYAFAGCDSYFSKIPYIIIALAPVVFFGIVFALICPFLSHAWFWAVYILQVANLSGAAGDIYVTAKFIRLPKNILIKDVGIGMTVYSR